MMELITKQLNEVGIPEIKRTESSVLMVSPYLTNAVVNQLLEVINDKKIELVVVTRSPSVDYVTGLSDYEAVKKLDEVGCRIFVLENLQTSLYLLDEELLILGSDNSGANCLGISFSSKNELVVKSEVNGEQVNQIHQQFVNHPSSKILSYSVDLAEKIAGLKEKYGELVETIEHIRFALSQPTQASSDDHRSKSFLYRLKQERVIVRYEELEDLSDFTYKVDDKYVIKMLEPIKNEDEEPDSLHYEIPEEIAEFIKKRKIHGLVLFIEGNDNYVCLPSVFLKDKILKKVYREESQRWSLKIHEEAETLLLEVKGKYSRRSIEIDQYKGGLHFRIKGRKV